MTSPSTPLPAPSAALRRSVPHRRTTGQPTRRQSPVSCALAVLVATGAFVAALVLPAGSAQAANYQFWGYYQLTNGTWAFAQTGPDQTTPKDGAVEGWRWAVSDDSGKNPRTPRLTPAFADVCGTTAAPAGQKHVAVVVDYGREADGDGKTPPPQPLAKCATVPTAATGSQVLSAVTTVRVEKGLVCGIGGYPATGCGGQVATLTPEQAAGDTPIQALGASAPTATDTAAPISAPAVDNTAATSSSGLSAGAWVAIVVAVLVIAAIAYAAYRRRQTQV